MNKEDIIKFIDGDVFYKSDYVDFLYKQLEMKDLILKCLHKYYDEHEQYEDEAFLIQLENSENDIVWLKKYAGENDE